MMTELAECNNALTVRVCFELFYCSVLVRELNAVLAQWLVDSFTDWFIWPIITAAESTGVRREFAEEQTTTLSARWGSGGETPSGNKKNLFLTLFVKNNFQINRNPFSLNLIFETKHSSASFTICHDENGRTNDGFFLAKYVHIVHHICISLRLAMGRASASSCPCLRDQWLNTVTLANASDASSACDS